MDTLLQKLENNEAILQMYLAGELSDGESAEVRSMLDRDSGMRAQLDELRATDGVFRSVMAELDRARPVTGEAAAVRRVARAMAQWKIDRLTRPSVDHGGPARLPKWAWTTGSVAAACVLLVVWWSYRSTNLNPTPLPAPYAGGPDVALVTEPATTLLKDSLQQDATGLSEAETDASTLVARSDDASTASVNILEGGQ